MTDHPRATTQPDLVAEQARTLAAPRLNYGLLGRALFLGMDLVYGRRRSLSKFKVLEIIARVPYQAWEQVAYVAMTHKHGEPNLARRIFEFVSESRAQQDNEQWHLLILEELIQSEGKREGFLRFRVLPQLIALFYYHVSWLLYVLRPGWSYSLNAHFEDHAEHEYALLVREHPEWEDRPYEGDFAEDFGRYDSLADLFRQISYDERLHKEESELTIAEARFGS